MIRSMFNAPENISHCLEKGFVEQGLNVSWARSPFDNDDTYNHMYVDNDLGFGGDVEVLINGSIRTSIPFPLEQVSEIYNVILSL